MIPDPTLRQRPKGPCHHTPNQRRLKFPTDRGDDDKAKARLILEMFDTISIGLRLKASSPSIKSNIQARLIRRRNS